MLPSSLPPPTDTGPRRGLLRRLAVLAATLALAPAALALEPPRGRVLLSITGQVGKSENPSPK